LLQKKGKLKRPISNQLLATGFGGLPKNKGTLESKIIEARVKVITTRRFNTDIAKKCQLRFFFGRNVG